MGRKFLPDWTISILEAQDHVINNKFATAIKILRNQYNKLYPQVLKGDVEAARIRSILKIYIEELLQPQSDYELRALVLEKTTPSVPKEYSNGVGERISKAAPYSSRTTRLIALKLNPSPNSTWSRWWTRPEVSSFEWGDPEVAISGTGTSFADDLVDESPATFGPEMDNSWWEEQYAAPSGLVIEKELEDGTTETSWSPNWEHLNLVSRRRDETFDVLVDRVQKCRTIEMLGNITSVAKLLQAVAISIKSGQNTLRDKRPIRQAVYNIATQLNQRVWGSIIPARMSSLLWGLDYKRAAQVINRCAERAYQAKKKPEEVEWTDLIKNLSRAELDALLKTLGRKISFAPIVEEEIKPQLKPIKEAFKKKLETLAIDFLR